MKMHFRTPSREKSQLKRQPITKEEKDHILNLIFKEYDQDKDQRFTRNQFPQVIKSLASLIGAVQPSLDDMEDLFNMIDVNGDQSIDRQEFISLLNTFFKIIQEANIPIKRPQSFITDGKTSRLSIANPWE